MGEEVERAQQTENKILEFTVLSNQLLYKTWIVLLIMFCFIVYHEIQQRKYFDRVLSENKIIGPLEEFIMITRDRHYLPFPGLESRLSSAIVLSYQGISKEVIKLTLVLSKRSRVFIISQEGLKGFLLKRRTCFKLLLKELEMSSHLRR